MLFPWVSDSSLLWTCHGAWWSRCDGEACQWKLQAPGLCSRLSLAETNEAYLQLFLARQFDLSNRKWQLNKLLRFCHFECYHISFLFPFFMLSWADQSLVKQTPSWTFPQRISMIILSRLEALIKRSCVSSANNTPYANSTMLAGWGHTTAWDGLNVYTELFFHSGFGCLQL